MAKRRKKRGQSARAKGAAHTPAKGRVSAPKSSRTPPAESSASPALGDALRSHSATLYGIVVGLVVFAGLYGACLVLDLHPTIVVGNADLAAQPAVLAIFAGWCLAAAYGLVTRTPWGWWLAASLAQFQLWQNAWRAVLSDVATDQSAGSSDLILLTSAVRLVLWTAAALYLHGHPTAQHYGLSWTRDEERKRTHRVIYYGLGVLLALHLGARYFMAPTTTG